MKFRHGWLLNTAAIAVIVWMAGNGVAINDLSFASFNGDDASGNLTQPDVACYPQFSATRGAGAVGGTTNCVEP